MQAFAEGYLIPAQLVLAMLGMGATLSVRDFVDVMRDGKGVLLGLALQLIFVPLVTLGFIEAFSLSKGWAVGLILIAVVPGGAFSNLLTFIGKANTALSVSVTLVSTLGSIFTVPLLLAWMAAAHLPADFQVPTGRIVFEIFSYLLAPLGAGMWLLARAPSRAQPISRWSVRGSLAILIVIVASSLGTGRIKLEEYGWGPPLTLILFGVILVNVTPLLTRLAGRYDDDTVALTIEVACRNIGLALLLFHFFFPGDPAQRQVLYSCLFYAGMSFFLGVPVAVRHRRGARVLIGLSHRRRPVASSEQDLVKK